MVQGALMQMGVNPQNATSEQLQQAQGAIMGNFTAMGFTELANADGSMNPNSVKASYDAEIEMSWPQLVDFSLSYSPLKTTTFYADLKWVNWENAMKDFKMTMTKGSNANVNIMIGSDEVPMVMPLNWENQIIFALGVNHVVNDMISLRLGYNYGKNPVPAETLIPIFPAVVEQHFTGGVSINATDKIGIDLGCEFVPEVELTVGSTESIIANEYNGSTSSLSELLFHFGLNYKF
jgi:long-chain fatty acid transport protein